MMAEAVQGFVDLSKPLRKSLCKLHKEFDEGELTKKAFWNKKIEMLSDILTEDVENKMAELKKDMKNEEITKAEMYEELEKLLASFSPVKEDEVENDRPAIEKTPRRSREAKTKGQQTLTAMFSQSNSKRKSTSDKMNVDKKVKTEQNGSDAAGSSDPASNGLTSALEDKPSSKRCDECRQFLDDPDLKCFSGDANEARDEVETLTDPKLSLFDGDSDVAMDERPQHKVTAFSVYDKCTHLCAFDVGLIERNKELYFSGYVKPIYDDNPSTDGGLPTRNIGPINEWFTHGFDGAFPVIGFSTAFAEYYLMEPSEEYESFMMVVKEKVFMSNLVISFLVDDETATYEDLLNKIQTVTPPPGVTCGLTEDTLLRHAQFICDQVQSFDAGADDDETLIISTSCMRALIKLAGVTLGGGRRGRRQMTKLVKKEKGPKGTFATVTPLVAQVFNSLFKTEIDSKLGAVRRKRCMTCEACLAVDCGTCTQCKDMVKFGGSGRSKQCCELRRCTNKILADENDEVSDNDDKEDEMDKKVKLMDSGKTKRKTKKDSKNLKIKWDEEPFMVVEKKQYYKSVTLRDEVFHIGDNVCTINEEHPDVPDVGRIQFMWKKGDEAKVHIHWFCRGSETVLGETAEKHELFIIDDCELIDLKTISCKAEVIHKTPSDHWFSEGGNEDTGYSPIPENAVNKFFYQKWYDIELGRFEDEPIVPPTDDVEFCPSCARIEEFNLKQKMILGDKAECDSHNKTIYKSVKYQGYEYSVGDCCFLEPDSFSFKIKQPKSTKSEPKALDLKTYPEAYRKNTNYIKGSNDQCPDPYQIGRILEIYKKDKNDDESVTLKVAKFYRPENTHRGVTAGYQTDLHMVYWSDEEATVPLSSTDGKLVVRYIDDEHQNPATLFDNGAFYFREAYDADVKAFVEAPRAARQYSTNISKGKGKGKGKGSAKSNSTSQLPEVEKDVPFKPLRCLDVFAGCGGLSAGLHQAGVAESKWAIEIIEPAAQAYRLNSPDCTVFTDDCNYLLKLAIEGAETNRSGQKLPKKGEVELLCGGPPCQGFSGMNRFNTREYSRFKNSLISSYLSYCDFYRPKFFILENVRNFVSYKNSMILKTALRCLVAMGYQCTFGVMQAGSYGVAQTRRRAIILAAAPGEKLPFYPEPLHVFAPRAMQLSVVIDERKYMSNITRYQGAPYRTITVRDCMSDLPDIKNGHKKAEMSYNTDPESHFQRMIRGNQHQPVLRDHTCKEMNSLVAARMSHIPTGPGSDWRDLPNMEVRLPDGSRSKLLKYTHHDKKNGRGPGNALRGVCQCVDGVNKCDPGDRQFNTLIPWCLPHTGNRHNHWAGLYGRLEWDGFFSTTVTNPEPMGKQGRVLHPCQHRVVSVRECARSQGFPDSFKFFGTTLDKHRQVGNAVPPPLGKALGDEMKKCLIAKVKMDAEKEENAKMETA